MNSYNDNLQSAVVSSLLSQQIEQRQIEAEWNASMFTLYHAQGATITSNEKLEQDEKDLNYKTEIRNAAVDNNNSCVNLLSSTTQAQQYLKQSVTNTAVSAANIQIAANAIVKLAGDMGNAYSIVQAADYDSEIYKQAEDARTLMNLTAYEAELASQIAMESSMLTSEVSSSAVLDKSKTNNNLMSGLFKILTSDFNTASENVRTDSENIAAASAAEKAAEGDYEDIDIDYKATQSAYNSVNKGLNLNLTVSNKTNHSFEVSFDLIRVPFPADKYVKQAEDDSDKDPRLFPVENYYVIVVKQNEQYTFTATDAESILLNYPHQYTKIDPKNIKELLGISTERPSKKATVQHRKGRAQAVKQTSRSSRSKAIPQPTSHYVAKQVIPLSTQSLHTAEASGPSTVVIDHLHDSDDEAIQLGVNYVVFVYAKYQESYKRLINNFEDFLSASSLPFYLSNPLKKVSKITWTKKNDQGSVGDEKGKAQKSGSRNIAEAPANGKKNDTIYTFSFNAQEDPNFEVEYRLMFLPKGKEVVNHGMLTTSSMKALAGEIKTLEEIATYYDLLIEKAQKQQAEYTVHLNNFQSKYATQYSDLLNAIRTDKKHAKDPEKILEDDVTKGSSAGDNTGAPKKITIIEKVLGELYKNQVRKKLTPDELTMLSAYVQIALSAYNTKKEISEYEKKRDDLIVQQEVPIQSKGFLFNETLAQEVPAGNYIQVKFDDAQSYDVAVGPETTDNFGNLLMNKNEYYPVVLSTPTINVDNPLLYTSILSDIDEKHPFTFEDPSSDDTAQND